MTRSTHKNLSSPIIGRVVVLTQDVLRLTSNTPNSVKHPFVDELKKDLSLLFKYALRQLNDKDYYKRTVELLEEINAQIYLIFSLDGLRKEDVAKLDCMCMEIREQLNSIRFGQNVESNA